MATNQEYFDAVLALKQARIDHDTALVNVSSTQTVLNTATLDTEAKFRTMEDSINVGTNAEQKTRAVNYGKAVRVEYNARTNYNAAIEQKNQLAEILASARQKVIQVANELASDPV